MPHKKSVNPAMLAWARESAGFDLRAAAERLNIKATRLRAIEGLEQEAEISASLFDKMVRAYRQPPLVFYLSSPPRPEGYETAFRKVYEQHPKRDSALIAALVRNVWARQSILKAALEAEQEARTVPFVGSLSLNDGLERAVDALTEVVGGRSAMDAYRSKANRDEAFKLVRSEVEKSGAFVVLKGDLGNYHSNIPVEEFRGLAISDPIAPFILVNPHDSPPARSFTLLHETVHLLLGKSSISKQAYGDTAVEKFCSQAASNCLLPESALDSFGLPDSTDIEEQSQAIRQLAASCNLSGTMVAYRLFLSGRIERSGFTALRDRFRSVAQARQSTATSGEGPSYYTVRRSRIGQSLLKVTRRMLDLEAISTTKAAKILDVRPINVGKVLDSA